VFRPLLRLATPAAFVLAAVAASACIAPAGAVNPTPSPSPSAAPVADPDSAVIRVDLEGGFVSPAVTLGRTPMVLVAGDGRYMTQGPQIDIWPGPLLPNLRVRTLTREALERLLALAKDKGLLADGRYEFPGVSDAATTVLRITVGGETFTVSAYALGDEGTDDGRDLPSPVADGRAAMRSFIDALTGLPESAFSDQDHAYVPDALRVYARTFVPSPDADWQPITWPLADLATAGAAVGNGDLGIRCQVIAGADLATVMPLLEGANQATPFRSAGADWTLSARPLLPGESGC
jgi:hypothetical protein